MHSTTGVVLVTLPPEQVDELFRRAEEIEGYQLSVDLETMTITDDRQSSDFLSNLNHFRRNRLLKGLDDIGSIWNSVTRSRILSRNKTSFPLLTSLAQSTFV